MNLMISMLTGSLCLTLSPNISPINMAFMIIIMTILSAIIIAHFKTWLSLILTLIFLGGMMIIVLYITKMTKKNFYQEKMKITMPLLISTILIINTLLTNSQPSTPNFHKHLHSSKSTKFSITLTEPTTTSINSIYNNIPSFSSNPPGQNNIYLKYSSTYFLTDI
uniref:NADH dehydrogenase subunit 6 n=1 Tax=Tachaea chinensis TaxID=1862870 RepID=UPI000EF355A9|nr:NADH dehydrogenase subunit 6 [Tachaea chinensis]ATO58518.1 NADH dehydrogenase subunit 6 [Tachaea chinensis]